ncbi:MAG: hypothetical protein LBU18_01015 [Treponema sp.]|nr:hypothetical protein [Treponema sp.]
MTHLYGNKLTWKDDPVIVFRGKLDNFAAMILEAQILGEEKGNSAFIQDLGGILEFTRGLLSAEYRGTPLGEFHLLGFSSREVREQSHHPEKYLGRGHPLIEYAMGPLSLRLNLLRTAVREVELAAVPAFKDEAAPGKFRRLDIMEALNRLSSLFYILMFKYLPEGCPPSDKKP